MGVPHLPVIFRSASSAGCMVRRAAVARSGLTVHFLYVLSARVLCGRAAWHDGRQYLVKHQVLEYCRHHFCERVSGFAPTLLKAL